MFKRALEKTALLAFGLAIGVLIGAPHAEGLKIPEGSLKFDFGFGKGEYHEPPDGMFFQKNQKYTHEMTRGTQELGLAWQPTSFLEVSAHLVNFSTATTDAIAVTAPGDDSSKRDNTLNPYRQECQDKFREDTCANRWKTAGRIRGVELFASYKAFQFGDFSLWPGLGVLAYKAQTSSRVYSLDCAADISCKRLAEIEQKVSPYLSPVVGFSVRYDFSKYASVHLSWKDTLRTVKHVPISANFADEHKRLMIVLQTTLL